jgi:hypothetical protein
MLEVLSAKRLEATHFITQHGNTDDFKDVGNGISQSLNILPIECLDGVKKNFEEYISIQLNAIFKIKYKCEK